MNNQLLFWKEKDKKKKLIEKKKIPFQKVIIAFLKMRQSRVSNIADPMLPYQEKRTNILKQIVKEITTIVKWKRSTQTTMYYQCVLSESITGWS